MTTSESCLLVTFTLSDIFIASFSQPHSHPRLDIILPFHGKNTMSYPTRRLLSAKASKKHNQCLFYLKMATVTFVETESFQHWTCLFPRETKFYIIRSNLVPGSERQLFHDMVWLWNCNLSHALSGPVMAHTHLFLPFYRRPSNRCPSSYDRKSVLPSTYHSWRWMLCLKDSNIDRIPVIVTPLTQCT
jgi:hypothetical protein